MNLELLWYVFLPFFSVAGLGCFLTWYKLIHKAKPIKSNGVDK